MNPTTARSALLVALLTAGVAGTALAGAPINQTRPLDANGDIEIENLKGRIEVHAWDRPEVRIQGTLGEGVEKLEIEGDRQRLVIRVKYPNRGGFGFRSVTDKPEPTDLRVMVPVRANLEIDSVSASVDVTGVASRELSIDSVSGDITVAAAPRRTNLNSVSGDLRLTLNSADVSAESVSGDVRLRGRLDGDVAVQSVSGDIDIAVLESSLRKLSVSTVSGDAQVDTALANKAQVQFESVSGDVSLSVPRSLSANVRGESFSGDLEAPGATIDRPRHGPGASFEHRYGSGAGDISIETFSGDARLRLK